MKWNLFLKLGHSITSIYAHSEMSEPLKKDVFTPSKKVYTALSEFIDEHQLSQIENIYVSTTILDRILDKELWEDCAFFTTSGFENWLDMNLPQSTPYFNLHTERVKSPLHSNFSFGIDERVNPQGQIEKKLDTSDLKLYLPKLQLHNIKSVALGFMNSHLNNENLLKAVHFFKEKGFHVYFTEENLAGPYSETDYWLLNLLRASTSEMMRAYLKDIFVEEKYLEKLKILSHNSTINFEDNFIFNSIHGEKNHIYQCSQELTQENFDCVIYAGYENLYYSFNSDEKINWSTRWGELPFELPPLFRFSHQPTQELTKNIWNLPQFATINTQKYKTPQVVGYEPGPISLGKGVRLTLIDLIYLYDEDFKSFLPFKPKRKKQIFEALASLSYRPEKIELTETLESLLESFAKNTLMEIKIHSTYHDSSYKKENIIYIWGPLAQPLYKIFKKFCKLKQMGLQIHDPIDEDLTLKGVPFA